MMATSLVTAESFLNRLEGEGDEFVALVVGGERNHGQLDVHAELQFLRIVLGQPALDADDVVELNEPDAERHEVLARRPLVRRPGRKALRRPRDEGAATRQVHVRHVAGTAPGAALLHRERGGAARRASATDQLRILVGPGRDLGRERLLLCRHPADTNRKWHSRLERTHGPRSGDRLVFPAWMPTRRRSPRCSCAMPPESTPRTGRCSAPVGPTRSTSTTANSGHSPTPTPSPTCSRRSTTRWGPRTTGCRTSSSTSTAKRRPRGPMY